MRPIRIQDKMLYSKVGRGRGRERDLERDLERERERESTYQKLS